MSNDQAEHDKTRERIGGEWNDAANGWRNWESSIQNFLWPVTHRMIDLAGLRTGMQVLDVGTGTGDVALAAAYRVGASGSVLGIDLAPEMLQAARDRARALRLERVTFEKAEGDRYVTDPHRFDVIVGRFSVIFFPDLVAGLRRLRTLVKPDGRVCFASWTSLSVNKAFAIPREAMRPFVEIAEVDPDAPGPLRLSGEGQFADALRRAGYADIVEEEVDLYQFAPSREAYWQMLVEVSASFRRQYGQLASADQQGVQSAVMKALEEWTVDGVVRVPARARIVAASPG